MLFLSLAYGTYLCPLHVLPNKLVIHSLCLQKLMLVSESILCLLYPFQWAHVYVPILPPMLENFLDAPVPYIMGLLRRTNDMNVYCRGSVCIGGDCTPAAVIFR